MTQFGVFIKYIESLNPLPLLSNIKKEKKNLIYILFILYRVGTRMPTRKENEENKENIKKGYVNEWFIEFFFTLTFN